MKKSNVVMLSIFLVLISVMGTFFATNFIELTIGDKVVISRESMDAYQKLYSSYSEVNDLKTYIETNYYKEVDDALLYEGMKKGMFEVLNDPYSVFMNAEEFSSYMESSSGEYPGIGIYLTPNDNNEIEIVSPIEDTPADHVGLQAKDLIVAVNGEEVNAEVMDEAISKIKGEPGTAVTITIYRPSKREKFDVEIVRAWIDVKVVKSRMIDDEIGYLRLSMFDENAAEEFKKHMDELVSKGAKKVVIDLRQNPGGYLDQCVDISDSLLGKSLIVYTDSRNGDHESFESDAKHYDVKLAVLVDEGSASASEILTGALKDNHAATIIGVTTFGKGIVQVVRPYLDDTGYKLTTAQYFTPNGENIHGIGIEPDIVVPLDDAYLEKENPTDEDDNQLQKALEILRAE
ncbi:MAG: carboxyl-terminal processing protease [Clostridiales bacterium]|nr:carboxyl-terminal processing protease [Clostridiales bacterium]MDN5297496.1 carboxyl-terminal processing protease [Clostridiales bacterium]